MAMRMKSHRPRHPQDAVKLGHELIELAATRQGKITLPARATVTREMHRFKKRIQRHESRTNSRNPVLELLRRPRLREMQGLPLRIKLDLPVFGQQEMVSRPGNQAGGKVVRQHGGPVRLL